MTAKNAIKRIQGWLDEGYHKINNQTMDWSGDKEALEFAIQCMNAIRPQGEWKTVEGYDGDEYYECTNCGEPWFLSAGTPKDNNMNFCPNCGADMRKGDTE